MHNCDVFRPFELLNKTLEGRQDFDTLLTRREFFTLYILCLNCPLEFGYLCLIYI